MEESIIKNNILKLLNSSNSDELDFSMIEPILIFILKKFSLVDEYNSDIEKMVIRRKKSLMDKVIEENNKFNVSLRKVGLDRDYIPTDFSNYAAIKEFVQGKYSKVDEEYKIKEIVEKLHLDCEVIHSFDKNKDRIKEYTDEDVNFVKIHIFRGYLKFKISNYYEEYTSDLAYLFNQILGEKLIFPERKHDEYRKVFDKVEVSENYFATLYMNQNLKIFVKDKRNIRAKRNLLKVFNLFREIEEDSKHHFFVRRTNRPRSSKREKKSSAESLDYSYVISNFTKKNNSNVSVIK